MSNSSCYYEILKINKTATQTEIKKAYHKLALIYHPDRNQNDKELYEIKFKKISCAYQILSDKDKKKQYDLYGEEGLNNMNNGLHDMSGGLSNIFNNLFKEHKEHQYKNQKPPTMQKIINVELKQLYTGYNASFILQKKGKCDICDGIGCNNNNIITCDICSGTGNIRGIRRIGPIIQPINKTCYKCKGNGTYIHEKDRCSKCFGNKYILVSKSIDFYIHPGRYNGETTTLRGEGNWTPNYKESGDLCIIINEVKSKNGITRQGENLIYIKKLDLVQALTGTIFIFKHLDDRLLNINTKNLIIKPNQIMKISNQGMKVYGKGSTYGDLIIKFNIIFPETLSQNRKKALINSFPVIQPQIWDIDPKKCKSEDTILEYYDNQENYNQENDSDNENYTHNNAVNCSQQ